MKDFLLFIGEVYYPEPGFGDFFMDFDSYEEAYKFVEDLRARKLLDYKFPQNNYASIVCFSQMKEWLFGIGLPYHSDKTQGLNSEGDPILKMQEFLIGNKLIR